MASANSRSALLLLPLLKPFVPCLKLASHRLKRPPRERPRPPRWRGGGRIVADPKVQARLRYRIRQLFAVPQQPREETNVEAEQ